MGRVVAQVTAHVTAHGVLRRTLAALLLALTSARAAVAASATVAVRAQRGLTAWRLGAVPPTMLARVRTATVATDVAVALHLRVGRAHHTAGPAVIGILRQVAAGALAIALPRGTHAATRQADLAPGAPHAAGPTVLGVVIEIAAHPGAGPRPGRAPTGAGRTDHATRAHPATATAVRRIVRQVDADAIAVVGATRAHTSPACADLAAAAALATGATVLEGRQRALTAQAGVAVAPALGAGVGARTSAALRRARHHVRIGRTRVAASATMLQLTQEIAAGPSAIAQPSRTDASTVLADFAATALHATGATVGGIARHFATLLGAPQGPRRTGTLAPLADGPTAALHATGAAVLRLLQRGLAPWPLAAITPARFTLILALPGLTARLSHLRVAHARVATAATVLGVLRQHHADTTAITHPARATAAPTLAGLATPTPDTTGAAVRVIVPGVAALPLAIAHPAGALAPASLADLAARAHHTTGATVLCRVQLGFAATAPVTITPATGAGVATLSLGAGHRLGHRVGQRAAVVTTATAMGAAALQGDADLATELQSRGALALTLVTDLPPGAARAARAAVAGVALQRPASAGALALRGRAATTPIHADLIGATLHPTGTTTLGTIQRGLTPRRSATIPPAGLALVAALPCLTARAANLGVARAGVGATTAVRDIASQIDTVTAAICQTFWALTCAPLASLPTGAHHPTAAAVGVIAPRVAAIPIAVTPTAGTLTRALLAARATGASVTAGATMGVAVEARLTARSGSAAPKAGGTPLDAAPFPPRGRLAHPPLDTICVLGARATLLGHGPFRCNEYHDGGQG